MLYEVTVTNDKGIEGVVTSTSKERFLTSHPTNDHPGTNPEELMGAAWATCLNATIKALLSARGHGDLASRVDVRVSLHKGEAGLYFRLDTTASIASLSIEDATRIVESAHKRCPVSKIIGDYEHVAITVVPYEN
ncbi:OsmC family protein [Carnobacteriaceae bacterium zg-C25]|nr:OsmC family protein [Carnobacteriaceae bacterium zg-C25]